MVVCVGLISAYLASHKLKDAMHTAKEAVQAFPHSAHLYVLMGKVLINCKQLTAVTIFVLYLVSVLLCVVVTHDTTGSESLCESIAL